MNVLKYNKNQYLKIVSIIFLSSLLNVFNSYSDEFDSSYLLLEDEDMFLDIPSVFSASKYEQKVTEAPASVSVVTSEEIRRYGYRDLADILRSIGGFYTANDRNYEYLGVRGFGQPGDYNSRILFLVDGQRINESVYDSVLLDKGFIVDIDLIDRVEVIRGPSSSLYGTSAFFATVNVITRKGRSLKGVEASVVGGSQDTYNGRLSYGNKFENGIELLLSGTYFETDGDDRLFFKEFDDPFTNNGVVEDADGERTKNFFGNLTYKDLSLQFAFSEWDKTIPTGSYETVFPTNKTFTNERFFNIGLNYEHGFENGLDLSSKLYFQRYKYFGDFLFDYSDAGDLSLLVINNDFADAKSWVGELQLAKTFSERHRLILGGEFRDNIQQDQGNFDLEVYLDDQRDSEVWALYFQDELEILDNLRLNLGIRHDHYSTFGNTTNPRLAVIYNPIEPTTIKFLYGEAFRAPNFFELFYNDGATTKAALDLDPEEIQTFELVVEQRINSQLMAKASLYHNEIENLIVAITDSADGFEVFINSDKLESHGAEFELEGKWTKGWSSRVSYAYQESENTDTDQKLENSPKHVAKFNVIAPVISEKIFLGLEIQYLSSRERVVGEFTLGQKTSRFKVGDYTITNLTLYGQEIFRNLDFSASVYNLFDKKFEDPTATFHLQEAIEQDGRTFYAKLTYSF